jgi:phospholipase C
VRSRPVLLTAILLAATAAAVAAFTLAQGNGTAAVPATHIQHLVVIYDENESFDHYFGTYPATPPDNGSEPSFVAAAGTPLDNTINDYENPAHATLLTANPNTTSPGHPANPARIDRANALTCDNNHSYSPEQLAFDNGLMDKFVQNTEGVGCSSGSLVMDYFDGNTVTGLWNLAQNFAMSDNFFGTTFGPSTPGAINLISGDTNGAAPDQAGAVVNGTDIGDPDPMGDDCASGSMQMSGKNIGDQMNTAGVTWGWFQGGFAPTSRNGSGTATCGAVHANIGGATITDYSAHHEPFQYYATTANPHHLPPTGTIGTTDQANHQYDLTDFDTAVKAGNLPQVSFLKAAAFEDAHPGSSDPLDEQRFIARTLDELEQSPQWSSTAVIITYDDSDGWYDHVAPTIVNHSNDTADSTICNTGANTPPDLGTAKDRCGHGPRLPFLLISPYSRVNYIDHTALDQTSIMKFIEFNWGVLPIPAAQHSFDASAGDLQGMFDFVTAPHDTPVYLDPNTGEVIGSPPSGVTSAPPPQPAPPAPTTTTTTAATPPPPIALPLPLPVPKPTPKPTTTTKPKLTSTTKQNGKKLTVTLKVTGLSTSKGSITVSVKLTKGKLTIASGKGTVKSGHLTVTLKAKKTLKKGTYTLTVTVTQAKKSTKFTKSLKLK